MALSEEEKQFRKQLFISVVAAQYANHDRRGTSVDALRTAKDVVNSYDQITEFRKFLNGEEGNGSE